MGTRIKWGSLSNSDKQKYFEYLLESKVEFLSDPQYQTYVACIRVPKSDTRFSPDVRIRRSILSTGIPTDEHKMAQLKRELGEKEKLMRRACNEACQPLREQFGRFCALLSGSSPDLPKLLKKAELSKLIDEVYDQRYATDLQQLKEQAQTTDDAANRRRTAAGQKDFPKLVHLFCLKRWGLKKVVEQMCWNLIYSILRLKDHSEQFDMFGRFLSETYDPLDMLFYLHARNAARQTIFPEDQWSAKPHSTTPGTGFDRATGRDPRESFVPEHDRASKPHKSKMSSKQVIAVVREVAPQKLLQAKILQRLDRVMSEAALANDKADPTKVTIGLDTFLTMVSEEFHAARGLDDELPPQAHSGPSDDANRQIAADFVKFMKSTHTCNFKLAFHEVKKSTPGTITNKDFTDHMAKVNFKDDAAKVWRLFFSSDKGNLDKISINDWESLERRTQNGARPDHHQVDTVLDSLSVPLRTEVNREADAVVVDLMKQDGNEFLDPEEARTLAIITVLKRRGLDIKGKAKGDQKSPMSSVKAKPKASYSTPMISPKAKGKPKAQTDLESSVRKFLHQATVELCEKAVLEVAPATSSNKWLVEALVVEFLPVTDGIMESLVSNDRDRWLELQACPAPGTTEQQRTFFNLASECHESMAGDIGSEVVEQLCRSATGTADLKAKVVKRAAALLKAGSQSSGTCSSYSPATSPLLVSPRQTKTESTELQPKTAVPPPSLSAPAAASGAQDEDSDPEEEQQDLADEAYYPNEDEEAEEPGVATKTTVKDSE